MAVGSDTRHLVAIIVASGKGLIALMVMRTMNFLAEQVYQQFETDSFDWDLCSAAFGWATVAAVVSFVTFQTLTHVIAMWREFIQENRR